MSSPQNGDCLSPLDPAPPKPRKLLPEHSPHEAPLLPIAITLLAAAQAQAWDASGHELVAQIAYNHCKPQTKQKIRALLHGAVFHKTIGGQHLTLNYENPATAARFADDVLNGQFGSNPYESRDYEVYHYCDLYWRDYQDASAHWPPQVPQDTVYYAIEHAKAKLRGQPSPIYATKTEALLFLLHFVGDVHQPLHVADNHDAGGHNPMPTWNGPIVPHSWWDAALTNTNWADSPSDPILHLRPSQARQSASLQTTTLKTIRLAALKLVANLNPASPYSPSNLDTFEWMRESYAYGSLNVYPATRPVSKDTLLAWQKEAQTRAATAGLRLAALLNKLAPEM